MVGAAAVWRATAQSGSQPGPPPRTQELTAACADSPSAEGGFRLRFGVAQFDQYDPLAEIGELEAWGFDYCEPSAVSVMSLNDAEFQSARQNLRSRRIQVEAMNSFFPGDLKVVGPGVDRSRLQDYLQGALARAEALGAKVIVFGSGDARMVPEGFSSEGARGQLQEMLTMAGDEVERNQYGMNIGIEPLRKVECNIVNSASEAYELALQTDHPRVRIIVDFYHLVVEREDPAVLRRVKDHVIHLHYSDPDRGRAFPRTEYNLPAHQEFFAILREIGYQGRLSLEASTSNFQEDAPAGLAAVRQLYAGACAA